MLSLGFCIAGKNGRLLFHLTIRHGCIIVASPIIKILKMKAREKEIKT